MITAFPPDIIVCLDKRYSAPRAYLNEDCLQLFADRTEEMEHDTSEDETVRARLVRSEEGKSALYLAHGDPQLFFRIGQFDRFGAAEVLSSGPREDI